MKKTDPFGSVCFWARIEPTEIEGKAGGKCLYRMLFFGLPMWIGLFLLPHLMIAQVLMPEVIAVSGGTGVMPGYIVTFTVGQEAIATLEGTEFTLTEGFQQVFSTSVAVFETSEPMSARVYPNPFTSEIQIVFDHPIEEGQFVRLYDAAGRLLKETRLSVGASKHIIPSYGLPVGLVWLFLFDGSGRTSGVFLLEKSQ